MNMKCPACVMKHLAAAISYAKEVQSGHGRGHELDHRPDLLGELVNAEHHLKLLDNNLHVAISELRKKLQENGTNPSQADTEYIRRLWKMTEDKFIPDNPASAISPVSPVSRPRPCGCGKKKPVIMSGSLVSGVTDIVVPLAEKGSHANLELRYALRSIEKYARGYRDIIVVGRNAPGWLRNVRIIDSVKDSKRKNITLFRKRLAAAMESDADYNLYWCDDYILLETMDVMAVPALQNGKDLWNYSGQRVWHRCLKATGEALRKHKRSTRDCESHTPSLNNRKKFIQLAEVFSQERETDPGLTVCALYHNYYGSPMLDMNANKATFERDPGSLEDIARAVQNKSFIGYSDAGFTKNLEAWLGKKFSQKSKYEEA